MTGLALLALTGCSSGFDVGRMGRAMQGAGAGLQAAGAPPVMAPMPVAAAPITMHCTSTWSAGQPQANRDMNCKEQR